jgi:hypothetical protein
MVLNATFNNISAILWQSVLLVQETGVTGENHQPAASRQQTLSHNNKKENQPLSVSIFRKCFNHEIWKNKSSYKNKLTCEFSTFFKELFLLDSISSSKLSWILSRTLLYNNIIKS